MAVPMASSHGTHSDNETSPCMAVKRWGRDSDEMGGEAATNAASTTKTTDLKSIVMIMHYSSEPAAFNAKAGNSEATYRSRYSADDSRSGERLRGRRKAWLHF